MKILALIQDFLILSGRTAWALLQLKSKCWWKMISEIVQDFLARHGDETHTGQERDNLAASEGLDEDTINELITYLDDYH